jgi:hypothetical protein
LVVFRNVIIVTFQSILTQKFIKIKKNYFLKIIFYIATSIQKHKKN